MDEYGLSSIIIWNTCLYVPLMGFYFSLTLELSSGGTVGCGLLLYLYGLVFGPN